MKMMRDGWLLAGALSLGVLACADEYSPSPGQIAPPKQIPEGVSTATIEGAQPTGEPVNTASVPLAVRRAVVADAARRFQMAESAVVLTRAEQLIWSDGSLGCPKPGQVYTQMLVPGFRVVATTSAGTLTYHTDSRGNVVSCGARATGPARQPAGTSNEASEPRTLPPPRSQPDR